MPVTVDSVRTVSAKAAPFNRPLAHAIGLSETVVYGTLVAKWHYYSERGMLDEEGWFFSTVPDLEESTSLTERQQKRCIDNLVKLGLVKCEQRGMPARRSFFIVDDIVLLVNILSDALAQYIKGKDIKITEQLAAQIVEEKKLETETLDDIFYGTGTPKPAAEIKSSLPAPPVKSEKKKEIPDIPVPQPSTPAKVTEQEEISKPAEPIFKAIEPAPVAKEDTVPQEVKEKPVPVSDLSPKEKPQDTTEVKNSPTIQMHRSEITEIIGEEYSNDEIMDFIVFAVQHREWLDEWEQSVANELEADM